MVSPRGGGSAGWLVSRVVDQPGGYAGDECASDESAGGQSAGQSTKFLNVFQLTFMTMLVGILKSRWGATIF